MIQCNVDKTTDAKNNLMKSRNQLLHQKINHDESRSGSWQKW
nr:hypothetical protein [Mycoplasmopsis bovis]